MKRCIFFLAFAVISCAPQQPEEAGTADTKLHLELQDSPLAVMFTNKGKVSLSILKPLDGSEHCWIMPYYDLNFTDAVGNKIGRLPRCGNHGFPYTGTKWPDDYLIIIPPGKSYLHPLSPFHKLQSGGVYTACFRYVFLPDTDSTPGGPYPAGLWRGEAVSNTVTFKFTSNE